MYCAVVNYVKIIPLILIIFNSNIWQTNLIPI